MGRPLMRYIGITIALVGCQRREAAPPPAADLIGARALSTDAPEFDEGQPPVLRFRGAAPAGLAVTLLPGELAATLTQTSTAEWTFVAVAPPLPPPGAGAVRLRVGDA